MIIEKELKHSTTIQVRFNDIDVLGHVNNAIYQQYYDQARLSYFREVVGESINWRKFAVVMVKITLEYIKPVGIDEKISVRTGISVIGDKSLTMVQEIYNPVNGEVKSQCRAVMAGYSALKNETISIPALWKEKIFDYEQKVEFKYPV